MTITSILIALLAFVAPVIFERKGGRAFIAFVISVWLIVIVVMNPIVLALEFWITNTLEAGAGFFAAAISFGLPVWVTAICIWVLKDFHASLLQQFYGSLVVGLIFLFFFPSESVFFIIAVILIEGVLG